MSELKQAGFSFIELISVVLILSILSIAAISSIPDNSINVAAQAEQLASDIRYVQALAQHGDRRYRISFGANNYTLSDISGAPVLHPVENSAQIFLVAGTTLSSGVSFLVFDGLGVPYTTATLPGSILTADAIINLTAGSATSSVRVSPDTGRVLVQ